MKRKAFVSMLLVAGLAGCDVPPPTSPAQDHGIPEAEATEPESAGGETGEPEAAEPQAAEPEPAPAPEAAAVEEVPCSKLKKGICKATRGCAWRDPPSPGCIEASEMADVSGDE
jgi:hypothetical protein